MNINKIFEICSISAFDQKRLPKRHNGIKNLGTFYMDNN